MGESAHDAVWKSGHESVINLRWLFTMGFWELSIWRRSSANMNTCRREYAVQRSDEYLITSGRKSFSFPSHRVHENIGSCIRESIRAKYYCEISEQSVAESHLKLVSSDFPSSFCFPIFQHFSAFLQRLIFILGIKSRIDRARTSGWSRRKNAR